MALNPSSTLASVNPNSITPMTMDEPQSYDQFKAQSTSLPNNWQSTYTGPQLDMLGWQPSLQDYAANNNAGYSLPSNFIPYSPPSGSIVGGSGFGGLSSLTNTGTTNMATNPLSQYSTPPTENFTPAPNLGVTPGTSATGSFAQGAPLPVTSTVQQAVTAAPSFYTDYLNNLATQGQQAASGAQYAGAQPLQEKAFNQVAQNVGNYQPVLENAINLASGVGNTNLAQAIGDVGEANIRRNLAPQATAGLVGSGQFGSSRGATALGDTIANAELGVTAQQAAAMQQDIANRLSASQQLGTLAGQTQSLGLGDVNALATLGGQQQTIAQNEQLFPMQQLTNESALLRGYNIPTSVSTATTGPGQQGQFAQSPLQQIMGLGSLASGLFTKNASGTTPAGNIGGAISDLAKYLGITNLPSNYNDLTGLTGNEAGNLDYFNANPTDTSYLNNLG